jgi:hypothetical protein
MIQLDCGNVPLKPSHRRHLIAHLRKAAKFGDRIGDFVLKLSLKRCGRCYEASAAGHDSRGEFAIRCRQHEWRDLRYELTRRVTELMHARRLRRVAA